MVTPVQVFRTTDGEVFADEAEALTHEASIQHKARIDAFLDKHYPLPTGVDENGKAKKSGPTRAIAAKAVTAWIADGN